MILVDNSLFARNGDILPTRWDSQVEAIHLLSNAKLNDNQESTVGLMIMGGRNPEILVTPIKEQAPINACINKIKIWGELRFTMAVDIASLALKHRCNKNQRQRLVVMVASPLKETEQDLKNVAKKARRNNIAIDIINLGEPGNREKLESFVAAVNNENNSNLVNLDAGLNLLTDVLCTSNVMGEGYGQQGFGGGGNDFDAQDAELQMILRISAEEHRRAEAEKNKEDGAGGEDDQPVIQEVAQGDTKMDEEQKNVEDEAKALNAGFINEGEGAEEKLNEEAENLLEKAKNLTIGEKAPGPEMKEQVKLVQDRDFIKDILGELDVDQNDEMIQELLNSTPQEATKLDGSWKVQGENSSMKWDCSLVLKSDASYEWAETITDLGNSKTSTTNAAGTYSVDGGKVVCNPALPDTVVTATVDGKNVKLVTKWD